MRYFSYYEPVYNEIGDQVASCCTTVSEEDIRTTYYPQWRERMIFRYGETHVNKNYWFEDCLDEWIVANGAWETK